MLLVFTVRMRAHVRRVFPIPFRQSGARQVQLVRVMLDFKVVLVTDNQRRHVMHVTLERTKLQLETKNATCACRILRPQALEVLQLVLVLATLVMSV